MQYQSEQINELAEALAKVQAVLEPADKNSTNTVAGGVQRKYSDLTAVYTAIRAVLPEHGLSVVQTMMPNNDDKAHVRTTLLHKSGQWIAGEIILPCDRQKGVQGIGSAITYARRYSLSAIVGVVSEEDDDGAGAMPTKKNTNDKLNHQRGNTPPPELATRNQVQRIQILLKDMGVTDREERMNRTNTWLSRQNAQPVSSTNELTQEQASKLIGVLENQLAGRQMQPGEGPFAAKTQ